MPESCEWCRVISIADYIQRGKSPKYSDIKQYPVIAQKCIQWTGISLEKVLFIEPQTITKYAPERFIQNNDILINSTGTGTLGRTGYFSDDIKGEYDLIVADSHVTVIRCNKLINSKYVYYFFRTPLVLDEIENKASGSTNQIELNTETIKSYLIPLPPFTEQQRIVNQLEILEPLIAQYDKYEKQETQLTADFPNTLKKSILQSAIQGKLVAQNPDNEPASLLLDKIRKEKEQLIKSGKLKRDKTESFIYKDTTDNSYYESRNGKVLCIDAEIPFEIPESWEWCRLKDIIELYSGRDLLPQEYNADNQGVPYITGASNISNGKIAVNRWTKTPAVVSINGDLLISCKGTVGAMAFNVLGNIHIARQIMAIRALYFDIEYIRMFLSWYMPNLIQQAKSMIPGISREHILDALIPVPPIKEQKRIIEKVNMIFALFY